MCQFDAVVTVMYSEVSGILYAATRLRILGLMDCTDCNSMIHIASLQVLNAACAWIRRVNHGFDFLGHRLSPQGIVISQRSLCKMQSRFYRLYEPGATLLRLVNYVDNWIRWARSGVALHIKQLFLTTITILQQHVGFVYLSCCQP